MSKLEFTPGDFKTVEMGGKRIETIWFGHADALADVANKRLAEILKDAPVVFGTSCTCCLVQHWAWTGDLKAEDTHSARLVDIQELGEKE